MLGDFPFSIPLLRLRFSLSSFLFVATYNFFSPFLPTPCPLLFLVSLSPSVVSPRVHGGFLPPDRGSTYCFCALVCHLVSRHRQIHSQTDRATTCSSIRFCPSVLKLRCTTCQSAVFLRKEKKVNEQLARWPQMKQLADVIFFTPHHSIPPLRSPPFFELGSTEHPDCCSVYLGQESSFMYMTPRQSRRTERGDEGR